MVMDDDDKRIPMRSLRQRVYSSGTLVCYSMWQRGVEAHEVERRSGLCKRGATLLWRGPCTGLHQPVVWSRLLAPQARLPTE